jgi:hypothetical protein
VPLAGLMPKRGTFVGTDFNRIHASARRPPWFATGSTEKAKKKEQYAKKLHLKLKLIAKTWGEIGMRICKPDAAMLFPRP